LSAGVAEKIKPCVCQTAFCRYRQIVMGFGPDNTSLFAGSRFE